MKMTSLFSTPQISYFLWNQLLSCCHADSEMASCHRAANESVWCECVENKALCDLGLNNGVIHSLNPHSGGHRTCMIATQACDKREGRRHDPYATDKETEDQRGLGSFPGVLSW